MSPARQMPSPIIHTPIPVGKYTAAVPFVAKNVGSLRHVDDTRLVPSLTSTAPSSQYGLPRPPTVPPQVFTPQPGQTGSTQPSHQRNLHDANEAKASRKTDIERRCQQLDPPISPNILRHMDSFKAAIQISQPMTDYAWSVLQPRLVAQLPAAQQAEANHVSHAASLSTKPTDRRLQDVNSKEAKEAMDREWEDLQRPIRDKLSAIADDFVNQDWDQGKALTFESCPKFAADLLAHVRRKYLDDAALEDIAATPLPQGPSDDTASKPKLVLENMKWVYDNKIKPLTEQYRKDLFYCNGQDCESSTRPYGFEGVVQHYGAKHTHAFSSGNVVVAWREAEWPEESPFHPDPVSIQHFHNGHGSNPSSYSGFAAFSRAGTTTPHMPMHLPQASPGPYGYGGHYNGPYQPPQAPSAPLTGYEYGQQYGTPVDTYAYAAMGPPGYGPPMGNGSYMPSPAMMNPGVAPPPSMPPPPAHDAVPASAEDAGHSTILFDKQVSTVIDLSQEIWKQTSGIKDMPNSLRVYILLHRVIYRFHVEFNHEPNLTHFIDALSNHEMPKNLKFAPGLSCKACQMESSHQLTGAHYTKPMERKTYTVLNLLSHFRTQHLVPQPYNAYGQQSPPLDWKEDMIELPSDRFISGFLHAPGMDDDKLLMIATTFPSLFPTPLPKIGVMDSNGLASPPPSGSNDVLRSSVTPGDSQAKSGPPSVTSPQIESSGPPKALEDEYDYSGADLSAHTTELSRTVKKHQPHRESPSNERRQRVYTEPRYHVSNLRSSVEVIIEADDSTQQMSRDAMEDGFPRSREYMDYPPSPRMVHAGPAYGEYTGRRTGFREHERIYGPPPDDLVYAPPREESHGREYGAYARPSRYYDDEDQRPEYRYVREHHSREAGSGRGQSAADRFLEDFDPSQATAPETVPRPPTQRPEPKPVPEMEVPEPPRFASPMPSGLPIAKEPELPVRQLAAAHPRAPSTVSNSSRYEDYHARHIPTPDSTATPRRAGPHRRRDRPHEHRMPSRYYRYMSVARDEPYGRGPNMSRSQSRRYEEQRRQIVQQETPQPGAEPDIGPAFSRDQSADQEDRYYPHPRVPREYVSIQDRLHPHPYSPPPRYRYEESRPHHQPVYLDEYGYEVVRVRGEPRRPYMPYPQPARYEQERYEYVPVPSYERPPPQRYNSRGEFVFYEERERERERALPRRPVPPAPEMDMESEVGAAEAYEQPGPEIKIESAPVVMPEGP